MIARLGNAAESAAIAAMRIRLSFVRDNIENSAPVVTRARLFGWSVPKPRCPGRLNARRLLTRASLLVRQVVGIVTEPVLVPRREG